MSQMPQLPLADNPRQRRLLVVATALLWWLSLSSAGLFVLGWIALTPFFLALSAMPHASKRFWFGWRSGILVFSLINWWILPAIVKGGDMIGVTPAGAFFLGILAVFLIGAIHGAGLAVAAALWNPNAKLCRLYPCLLAVGAGIWWWCFEALRASGPLAHSWGAPALSQWRDTALLQTASFAGQHGLSALCVAFAGALALWLHPHYTARRNSLLWFPLAVMAVLHIWGAWRVGQYDASSGQNLSVLLVQTNVASLRKNSQGGESHFDQALRVTTDFLATGKKADLVVWPETTATLSPQYQDSVMLQYWVGEAKTPLLTGAQAYEGRSSFNRASLIQADSSGVSTMQHSDKVRVVPFGERAPFGEYLPWLNALAPSPPVTPAQQASPLELKTPHGPVTVGSLICFESCFSWPARQLRRQGAKVFFVLTNDEWCAGTTAPWEHAVMSTLRTVENDVPVAQAANGGYSFAVDARGRFLTSSRFGEVQALEVKIPIR